MEVQIEFYRLFHKLRDFSEQLSGEDPNPILYICAALRSILITKYDHRYAQVLLSQTNSSCLKITGRGYSSLLLLRLPHTRLELVAMI